MSALPAEAHDELWAGEPAQHWEFPDKAGQPKEWDGWLLARESTALTRSRRWTEMEVYRTVAGHYVLRVLGCSVVYHVHGSACNTGDPMLGRDMDEDMEPCYDCAPPANYQDEEHDETVFDVDVEIPTIKSADTPEDLIIAMRTRKGRVGELSFLAARVLRSLKSVDGDVRRVVGKPERLV